MPSRIAIIGCGLVGGSLLKALHRRGRDVVAIDADDATRAAIKRELGLDAIPRLDAISDAFIVLATPVRILISQLASVSSAVGRDCIVTDVAGIKTPVLGEMRRQLAGKAAFVGGHPMAGKERGGFAESDASLFEGRVVALCSDDSAALDGVAALWHSVGARTVVCDGEEHDEAVARVSHLPYLVASALSTVAGHGDRLAQDLAAGGLRDTTRIAEDPTIRQALTANEYVAGLAREVAAELLALADSLDEHRSVDTALDAAAASRRRMFPNR